MKDIIKLVILPLYRIENEYSSSIFANLENTKNILSLEWLEKVLSSLNRKFKFSEISIEGSEVSLLSDFYFDFLFKLLETFNKKISVTTNFVNFNKSLINNADIINVLYNFNNNSDQVYKNIKAASSSGKIINIKSLDIFVKDNYLDKISKLNRLKVKAWKIIPYQKTKNNSIENYDFNTFTTVVKEYIKLSNYMQFSFLNKLELEGIIKTNNFPINTVYLTPNNKFGLGRIDKNNCFYIEEFENIESLEKNLKSLQNQQILLCKDCKYQLDCLADRYFNVNFLTKQDCNGYKNLINQIKGK